MTKKFKAIILVLASDDECNANTRFLSPKFKPEWAPLYPYFKSIWESYMFENPNIKVLFVYGGKANIQKQPYDLVYESVFENNHPGMLMKTLYAFADIDKEYDYDFLIRTNLSTFWDVHALESRLEKLPKQSCLTGTEIRIKDNNNQVLYHYIAGYDMVMSRDLVTGIVPHISEIIDEPVYGNMEDLAICSAIKKYLSVDVSNLNFKNYASNLVMKDQFDQEFYDKILKDKVTFNLDHFRIRSRFDRNIDKAISKKLLYDIYGKTLPES